MPEPGYTCETVNCDKIYYSLAFSDNQLIAGTQSLCNRFSFALMLKILVVSFSYHAASTASVNFAIVSKRRQEGIMPSCPAQNYNCVGPFFQNSLSSVVLLIGIQQDFGIRDCSNPRKQTAGMLKGKNTPEA